MDLSRLPGRSGVFRNANRAPVEPTGKIAVVPKRMSLAGEHHETRQRSILGVCFNLQPPKTHGINQPAITPVEFLHRRFVSPAAIRRQQCPVRSFSHQLHPIMGAQTNSDLRYFSFFMKRSVSPAKSNQDCRKRRKPRADVVVAVDLPNDASIFQLQQMSGQGGTGNGIRTA